MIAAARALFLERGYDAVTLGEVVRCSGGSLSTLYELFDNKAGLLLAILLAQRFDNLERLDAIVARGASAAETLRAIAESIQHDLTQPDVIGLMRIAMAESLRNPDFAAIMLEQAHRPRVAWLASLLAEWTANGQAKVANPVMAAEFFIGMVAHTAQTRALSGASAWVNACDAEPVLCEAARLFLAGYAIADAEGTNA